MRFYQEKGMMDFLGDLQLEAVLLLVDPEYGAIVSEDPMAWFPLFSIDS